MPDMGAGIDVASKVGGGKYKGAISGIADKISGVTSFMSKIPVIGPYASVATSIVDTVGDVASWFGFTREDAEEVPSSMMLRALSNPAHIDGTDTAECASLTAANNLSIDPRINGVTSAEDICSYESLFARWTLVKTMTWSSASASATILGSVPISPGYCNGTTSATGMICDLTTAAYVGLPFKYWRGDMEYMVICPVSKLHRGTLQIYWVPAGALTTATPTVAAMNALYDVSSDQVKKFTVGYAQDKPYLENIIIPSSIAIIPTGATNGRLVFAVANPLQAQLASTVDILVYARAGANMDYQVLNGTIPIYSNAGLAMQDLNAATLTYQGAEGDDTEEEDITILVPSSGEYAGDEILFGEKVRSVRALMQKFTYVTTEFTTICNIPHIPSASAAVATQFVFHTHYLRLFQGIAASTRLKMIPYGVNSDATANLIVGARTTVRDVLGTYPRQINNHLVPYQSANLRAAEFKFPYYFSKKYIEARVQWNAGPTWPVEDSIYATNAVGATVTFRTYRAFAGDIRPTCFVCVPRLTFTLAATPMTSYFL
jgi:hypothetical protein